MTVRRAIPLAITFFALACGLGAIEMSRQGEWEIALRLIVIAAIADGVDGPVARRLNADQGIGKQLDSLSDIVSFGVAPAFLFSSFYANSSDVARYGVALAFVGAGSYRLARFNALPASRDVFLGLPITAAGALMAIMVGGPLSFGIIEASIIAVVLTVLMVGQQPYPTYSRWRWTFLPALAAAAIPIALWPSVETISIVVGATLSVYVVWGVMNHLVQHLRADEGGDRLDEEVPSDVGPHA